MWVSLVTQQVLDASHHLTQDLKRQVVRMVAILSAYAVHDPATGYCQGCVCNAFSMQQLCWVQPVMAGAILEWYLTQNGLSCTP
jgi:hypothetical protein